jgi:hypothetical protein
MTAAPTGSLVLRWLSFRRCPAYQRGTCRRPYEGGELCQTFVCPQCGRRVPWCFGGTDDERCDACWCASANATKGQP